MNEEEQLFWNATVEELADGYIYAVDKESYVCLICHREYEDEIIYQSDGQFFNAKRAIKEHIQREHGSMFHYLIQLDKKLTGLTEVQAQLIQYIFDGKKDKDIAQELGISPSTVRNQRYKLREKEKQAKIYLALLSLLEKKKGKVEDDFISIHKGATMVDERYAITKEERDKVLETYFKDGLDGPLSQFPAKEKRKIIVLTQILTKFEKGKTYTEIEGNEILKKVYPDFATIRRYLIEYGFLDRDREGSHYWVKTH